MAKYDHSGFEGDALPSPEQEAFHAQLREALGLPPETVPAPRKRLPSEGSDSWGARMDRRQDAEHHAASRRLFLDLRDQMWTNGEVRKDTPFAHGFPTREAIRSRSTLGGQASVLPWRMLARFVDRMEASPESPGNSEDRSR